jgi:hypothetical protein
MNLVPKNNDNIKILEIGCGQANFRNNFSNTIEYWGVEPNPIAHSKATVILDKVFLGTYDEVFDQ